jgi:hypothetical protein
MPITPALRRLRQEDCKFKTRLTFLRLGHNKTKQNKTKNQKLKEKERKRERRERKHKGQGKKETVANFQHVQFAASTICRIVGSANSPPLFVRIKRVQMGRDSKMAKWKCWVLPPPKGNQNQMEVGILR